MFDSTFAKWDRILLHGIHDLTQCTFLDTVMPVVTKLGNGGAVWIASAGGYLFSKRYRRYGVILLGALSAGVLSANVFLKPFVQRARPCWNENVQLLIDVPKDYSFPSGHTLASVIGAYVLTAADRRIGYAAIPLAAAISFSRLYLYVHFPTDVAASVILGTVIADLSVSVSPAKKETDSLYPIIEDG